MTSIQKEKLNQRHFSPMGLVLVYVFDKTDFWETALVIGQYFFFFFVFEWFMGKVTLTFVSSPKSTDEKKNIQKNSIYLTINIH